MHHILDRLEPEVAPTRKILYHLKFMLSKEMFPERPLIIKLAGKKREVGKSSWEEA